MGRTCVAALIIKKPLDEMIIQALNDRLKPATVVSIAVTELSIAGSTNLSETDMRIIKCLLLSGARAEYLILPKKLASLKRPQQDASIG